MMVILAQRHMPGNVKNMVVFSVKTSMNALLVNISATVRGLIAGILKENTNAYVIEATILMHKASFKISMRDQTLNSKLSRQNFS